MGFGFSDHESNFFNDMKEDNYFCREIDKCIMSEYFGTGQNNIFCF